MSEAGISPSECWRVLQRRAIWVLLAGVCGAAISAAIWEGKPIHYTSEALLEVEAHSPVTRALDPNTQPTAPDQVRTQADILQSRALADSVIRQLNLTSAPDFKAAPRPPTWIDLISRWREAAKSYLQQLLGSRGEPDP